MIDVLIRSLHDDFGYGVWIYERNEATGEIRILKLEGAFKWEPYISGSLLPKPIFTTSTREGDLLFDKFIERLKEMGYGKDKLSIESGQLKAMREHLDDMKKLVFSPPIHMAPIVIGGEHRDYDKVAIKANRIRRAAKQCSQTKSVLAEIFPELFGPGWEHEAD